jgi:predicted nucleotidyltransferase
MVLMNDLNQPITVLYMPNSPVDEAINIQMQGFNGKIVALEQGSAAIISRPHESIAQIENALRNTLKPMN